MKIVLLGKMPLIKQFLKYLLVGIINTSVTLAVIWLCRSLLGMDEYLSNAVGYVAGLINSFAWNKKWVFQSNGRYIPQFCRFLIGFAVCYGLQFATVWGLIESVFSDNMVWNLVGITVSGYGISTIIGMMVYTVANYIYNRMVAFRA